MSFKAVSLAVFGALLLGSSQSAWAEPEDAAELEQWLESAQQPIPVAVRPAPPATPQKEETSEARSPLWDLPEQLYEDRLAMTVTGLGAGTWLGVRGWRLSAQSRAFKDAQGQLAHLKDHFSKGLTTELDKAAERLKGLDEQRTSIIKDIKDKKTRKSAQGALGCDGWFARLSPKHNPQIADAPRAISNPIDDLKENLGETDKAYGQYFEQLQKIEHEIGAVTGGKFQMPPSPQELAKIKTPWLSGTTDATDARTIARIVQGLHDWAAKYEAALVRQSTGLGAQSLKTTQEAWKALGRVASTESLKKLGHSITHPFSTSAFLLSQSVRATGQGVVGTFRLGYRFHPEIVGGLALGIGHWVRNQHQAEMEEAFDVERRETLQTNQQAARPFTEASIQRLLDIQLLAALHGVWHYFHQIPDKKMPVEQSAFPVPLDIRPETLAALGNLRQEAAQRAGRSEGKGNWGGTSLDVLWTLLLARMIHGDAYIQASGSEKEDLEAQTYREHEMLIEELSNTLWNGVSTLGIPKSPTTPTPPTPASEAQQAPAAAPVPVEGDQEQPATPAPVEANQEQSQPATPAPVEANQEQSQP